MLLRSTILSGIVLAASTGALAGQSESAQAHFKAIAAGNVDQVMQAYGESPALQWVGGPLDGSYAGSEKLKEVWSKFAKANAPLEVNVAKLEESINPKGSTVTANVEFKGKSTIKVRYVLVYRDGKVASEVWQIDPNLTVGY